ncbi:serine O-acetyltransferase [Lutimonas zeaxanthinifaciens]|uniref:serine O-acetyltransferase n=1 Tax=Lutimonas zeaxanthinifaciens TaxID=3060215 RepID=UPI00265CAC07|nr:DapH/DapD/GlmU-related protein [Lutimonas sp. YSD2104]WKK66466.1 DapH/DapD/GlmU-related protein [Lutimonas sp. YSD2104]
MPNAILFYHIARWFYLHKVPVLPKIIQGIIFLIYNCHISYKASIGKGSFLLHKGIATLILDGVVMGENTHIGMNVLITGKGPYKNVPIIGDNVWIGPGSIVSGPVKIENNVVVAPNAVVTKSVPEGAIVGGIPAIIIGWVKDLEYDILKNESFKEGYMDFLEDKKIIK